MSVDQAQFRRVAGSFASGVTVVTTGRNGSYHGMTASSFASVSMEPLLILVCLDRRSTTCRVVEETGAFNINILSADQQALSRAFSTPASPTCYGLEGVSYSLGDLGVPLLDGVLAYLECRTAYAYEGGDHIIFVGEVETAGLNELGQPLLYYQGGYHLTEALSR